MLELLGQNHSLILGESDINSSPIARMISGAHTISLISSKHDFSVNQHKVETLLTGNNADHPADIENPNTTENSKDTHLVFSL